VQFPAFSFSAGYYAARPAVSKLKRPTNGSSHMEPEISNGPRYPSVRVRLVGNDGNAFAIMARVSAALRRAGVDKAERDAFFTEATSKPLFADIYRCTFGKWV